MFIRLMSIFQLGELWDNGYRGLNPMKKNSTILDNLAIKAVETSEAGSGFIH